MLNKSYPRAYILAALLISTVLLSGCNIAGGIQGAISDSSTDAITVLEDAINALDRNSSDWQNILDDSIDELSGTADDVTVRLEHTMNRAIAQTGSEVHCTLDFIGDRVKEDLQVILADLKNEPAPPLKPQVCMAVPDNITAEDVPSPTSHLGFYGYNFDIGPQLQAYVERIDGNRQAVTSKLNTPTHYSMTLPFGSTGVGLSPDDQRIIITWQDELLVSVGITQPPPRQCEEREVSFTPSPITFTPTNHTQGDEEFSGHGPQVEGHVSLSTTNFASPGAANHAKVTVYMKAQETKPNWTTVSGTGEFDIYSFPPGFRILQRISPSATRSEYSYTDTDHEKDSLFPGQGPARKVVVVGDVKGKDVGRSRVEVHFNELRFLIREVGDCE